MTSATHTSYHFDMGDSNTGPIGLCARVCAESDDKAVETLYQMVAAHTNDLDGVEIQRDQTQYVEAYLNPERMSADDIDESEPCDCNALDEES